MSVNNDVYQMLVGTPVVDGSKTLSSMANYDIVCMDADTEQPIDLTSTFAAKRVYFASKYDDGMLFSPQFKIDVNRIKAMSYDPSFAGQTEIQYLKGFMPDVTEKEIELGKILQIFGIKIQAENKKLMKLLGLGAYTKTVFSDKVCFDMSDPTGWGNAPTSQETCFYQSDGTLKSGTDLVDGYKTYKKYVALVTLYNAINKNEDDYFKAYFATISGSTVSEWNVKNTAGTVGTNNIDTFHEMVEYLAINGDYASTPTEIFLCIESKEIQKKHFSQINMHYYKDRFTSLKVSLIEGFCCGAEMVVVQNAESSVGEGYDVMYREYRAGGWNGRPGPYRTYAVTGLAKDEIVYHASQGNQYDLYSITYEIERIAGWLDHRSWVTVEFAVPAADTTFPCAFKKIADAAGIVIPCFETECE